MNIHLCGSSTKSCGECKHFKVYEHVDPMGPNIGLCLKVIRIGRVSSDMVACEEMR